MDEDLADFVIKYAQDNGASYAEARMESTEGEGFLLRNGNLDLSAMDKVVGIGARVIVDGNNSFLSTNRMERDEVKRLIDTAIRTAKASARLQKRPVELSEEPAHKATYEAKQKKKLSDISSKDKLALLFDIEKEVNRTKIELPGRFFSLGTAVTSKYFTNSEGTRIRSTIPDISFTYLLTLKSGPKTKQRFYQYRATKGWEAVQEWALEESLVQECKNLDRVMREGVTAPKGLVDLVVGPEITGIAVHESSGHPSEADRIIGRDGAQAGESFLTPKMIGTRIGIPELNIVDDPVMEGSPGYYLYDDEGVKARRRFLVKDGKINEFLHNRQTAKSMGVRSNGSARSSGYPFEPIIRMSNTFALPGDQTLEELIEGVKKGVYIKSFMEWNIDDLRKNVKYVGNESYLIEDGKLTKPVSDPVIETTTLAYWEAVDAIGKELGWAAATCGKGEPMQGIPVWTGGPAMRLKKVRLGGVS